ncbi:MAG: diguanylate cyclase, partial [Sulfurimonas sp.]
MQKILVILLLVIGLYANDTVDLTDKEKAWMKNNPVVSYSAIEQKPLSIIQKKKLTGIMGAYLDVISKLTGLTFIYIPSETWTEVLEKFKNKEIDMIPQIVSSTNEINLGLASKTYVDYSMVIVTNKDYRFIQSIEDIKYKRFAIAKDEVSYNFVRMHYPGVSITPTVDIETALLLVKKGRADAFVGHIAPALYYMDALELSSLKVSGTTKFVFQHHFLLNKDNTILNSILNKAITAISNQQKANINAHWLKTQANNDINFWLVGLIVFILLFAFIYLFIRQRNLQKMNGNLEVLTHRMNLSLKSIKGGMWDLNLEDNSIYFDSNIKEMLGYKEYEFPNEFDEWKNRIHPDDLRKTMRDFHESIDNKYAVFDNVHRLKHKDGYWIWASILAKLVYDEEGYPVRMMGLISDITVSKNSENEIKRQKDVLFYQAHHDSLTSLPNRALFLDRLSASIARAGRDNGKVALLFIDLDEFKQINDSLGHNIGDKLLVAVTKRLNSLVRNVDTLSRVGGDEFTIIVDDVKNAQNAALVCQKVLNVLTKPILINEQSLYISASIG